MTDSPLANPSFRRLFAAQICSLLGVGLLTVALSLAAYRIGGPVAGGQILGLLLALKMTAYVLVAPLAETLLSKASRKHVMVSLDLGRMLLLLPMAFATQIWHIGALATGFFVLAAGFTPLFQSVVPDILPQEKTFTKALAWSRIAYTLEAILSPVIAAILLNLVSGEMLFHAAAMAFSGSVLALLMTQFPPRIEARRAGPFLHRAGHGLWVYWRTPRLQGLFLVNVGLSLAMAWVLVNTVVYAGLRLGDAARYYPVLMAFYGVGAVIGAIFVPGLLQRISERHAMLCGAFGFAATGAIFGMLHIAPMPVLAVIWTGFGVTSSLVMTPGALVITRSVGRGARASVFAAQFSLSHAGWLVAYPLAGWLAAHLSLEHSLVVLSLACAAVAGIAMTVWPADDPSERQHSHPELPEDHPHLKQVPAHDPQHRHVHVFHIDELHPTWSQKSF